MPLTIILLCPGCAPGRKSLSEQKVDAVKQLLSNKSKSIGDVRTEMERLGFSGSSHKGEVWRKGQLSSREHNAHRTSLNDALNWHSYPEEEFDDFRWRGDESARKPLGVYIIVIAQSSNGKVTNYLVK